MKVVPGAADNRVVGALGDRLKVRVCAVAESGKANRAVVSLLESALRKVAACDVTIVAGLSSPEKEAMIRGASAADVARALMPAGG